MQNRPPRVPKYGLHKSTGQAVVRVAGKDVYLGKYGTDPSRRRYDDLIRELLRKHKVEPRKPPPYRLHRADGRAVVTLNGKDFFLGKQGTPESVGAYNRLIAAWVAHGRQV